MRVRRQRKKGVQQEIRELKERCSQIETCVNVLSLDERVRQSERRLAALESK